MSLQKVLLFGSAVLVVVGLVLRLFGVPFGLDLMIVAVFVAVIAVSLAQRSIQHLLATTRRTLTQRVRELSEAQAAEHKAITELTTLQRTTLWYAKNRPGGAKAAPAPGLQSPQAPQPAGRAGRSSTPDVTNEIADVSFANLLDPDRTMAIGGILSDPSRRALPVGTTVKPFLPGRAVEALRAGGSLDLVVVDEAALASAPWSRSAGPAGIATMKDLLDAVSVAREQGVPTVIMPFEAVPDIHSAALTKVPALRLPLTAETAAQASGAPLTGVLRALDDVASSRRTA